VRRGSAGREAAALTAAVVVGVTEADEAARTELENNRPGESLGIIFPWRLAHFNCCWKK
jgi:hypothetical protein